MNNGVPQRLHEDLTARADFWQPKGLGDVILTSMLRKSAQAPNAEPVLRRQLWQWQREKLVGRLSLVQETCPHRHLPLRAGECISGNVLYVVARMRTFLSLRHHAIVTDCDSFENLLLSKH